MHIQIRKIRDIYYDNKRVYWISFVWIASICLIILSLIAKKYFLSSSIEVDFKSDNNNQKMCIFISEDGVFSDDYYQYLRIGQSKELQKLVFDFEYLGRYIRLDPGEAKGSIEINRILIRKNGFEVISLDGNGIQKLVCLSNYIDAAYINEEGNFVCSYTENDPFFVLELDDKYMLDWRLLFITIMLLVIIIMVIGISPFLLVYNYHVIEQLKRNRFIYDKWLDLLCLGILIYAIVLFYDNNIHYTFDSLWYIGYLDFFLGDKNLSEWPLIRGWGMPLIIYIGHIVKSGYVGIKVLFSVLYASYVIAAWKIFKLLKKNMFNNSVKIYEIVIFTLIVIFNPQVWVYEHLLLTEGVIIPLASIYVYFYLKYFFAETRKNYYWKQLIAISVPFSILFYFIKQSFVLIPVLILFSDAICSSNNIKGFIKKSSIIVIIILSVSISSIIWKQLATGETQQESDGYVLSVTKLRYFQVEGDTVIVRDDDYNEMTRFVYNFDGTLNNQIEYIIKCISINPERFIAGYVDNYMLQSGIFSQTVKDSERYCYGTVNRTNVFKTLMGDSENISDENSIFTKYIDVQNETESYIDESVDALKSINMNSKYLNGYKYVEYKDTTIVTLFYSKMVLFCANMIFALISLGYIIAWVYTIVMLIKHKNNLKKSLKITNIFAFQGMMFILFHCIVGSPINRYSVPVYAITLPLLLMLIIAGINKVCDIIKMFRDNLFYKSV